MRLHLLALAAVLAAAPLAACGSDATPEAPASGETAAPTASGDAAALADDLAGDYASGLGALDGFRVFGAGSSLYYLAARDSAQANPGATIFELVRDPDAAQPSNPNAARLFSFFPPNTAYLAEKLADTGLRGPVERNGEQAFVFESNVPADAGFRAAGGTLDHLVRVYVDAETRDVRELFHRFRVDTLAQPLAQRVLYDEYREVAEGVRLPFRVRQIQEGNSQLIPDEIRMMKGGEIGLRERQAQLLPPARRDSALREIAREKRFYAEGINEVELRIDSVVVNPPRPASLEAPRLPR